jgi:hypothetical protein
MNTKNINKIVSESLAIDAEAAKTAGKVGFVARDLVLATLPHRKPQVDTEFKRTNGNYTLVITAPSAIGLPYGVMPRLLLCWVITEAVRTQEPVIRLGNNLSDFMRNLGIKNITGGRWGTITTLNNQARKLFSAAIYCLHESDSGHGSATRLDIANKYEWWSKGSSNQSSLWDSTVTLKDEFFQESIRSPVPIDMRAIQALKGSSMALDIYCWLTYRVSYLARGTLIPWEALAAQFGSDYKHTRQFKAAFIHHLSAIVMLYEGLRLDVQKAGLLIKPSPPHVRKNLKD